MPNKTIYVKDPELWERMADFCAQNGLSVSEFIEQRTREYFEGNKNLRADLSLLIRKYKL